MGSGPKISRILGETSELGDWHRVFAVEHVDADRGPDPLPVVFGVLEWVVEAMLNFLKRETLAPRLMQDNTRVS
jgi:hypothetical protein